MYYFWLLIIVFLGLLEAFTINLVSIWFVISGIIALIISFFSNNFFLQFASFVILGIVLLLFTRMPLEKKLLGKKEKTNLDRIIGMKGVVTEEINQNKIGEVKVDGKLWSAIANMPLKKGEVIKVLNMKSVKLEVERWEE